MRSKGIAMEIGHGVALFSAAPRVLDRSAFQLDVEPDRRGSTPRSTIPGLNQEPSLLPRMHPAPEEASEGGCTGHAFFGAEALVLGEGHA